MMSITLLYPIRGKLINLILKNGQKDSTVTFTKGYSERYHKHAQGTEMEIAWKIEEQFYLRSFKR